MFISFNFIKALIIEYLSTRYHEINFEDEFGDKLGWTLHNASNLERQVQTTIPYYEICTLQ